MDLGFVSGQLTKLKKNENMTLESYIYNFENVKNASVKI